MDTKDLKRLEQTADILKAAGHKDRLAMLERLAERPWCVCELAADMGLNKSAASKHLSLLYTAGLVDMEKRGTQVIYSITAPCVVEMSRCCYLAVHRELTNRLGIA